MIHHQNPDTDICIGILLFIPYAFSSITLDTFYLLLGTDVEIRIIKIIFKIKNTTKAVSILSKKRYVFLRAFPLRAGLLAISFFWLLFFLRSKKGCRRYP